MRANNSASHTKEPEEPCKPCKWARELSPIVQLLAGVVGIAATVVSEILPRML